jgi:aminopeptidase N
MRYCSIIWMILLSKFSYADNYPRNYSIDMLHYRFELTLADSTDAIVGRTTIHVLFKTGDTRLIRLDFVNRTAEWNGKGMQVDKVLYQNKPISFRHEKNALLLDLPKVAEKNTTDSFVVYYRGVPADGLRIGNTRHGERSFFNENWPNRTRHWLPVIDHPYDKATCEFIVTAPAQYQVVSNGVLQEESMMNNQQKRTHWKQSVPISSWLFVLGVARFAVQQVDLFDHKAIQTWVYPQDREAGFHDFAYPSKEVLEFYSYYVGPFAYERLANIQSPSVGGGMETASAIFYGENLVNGKQDERLRNVVIHEIAHQWFGNAVTETTWDDAWLSEGFATYFTMLFQESAYGAAAYMDAIKKARKRVFDFYQKDSTYTIIANRTAEEGPVTNEMTYQKGAWFLHMLRAKMGHAAFRNGIRSYYQTYYNRNASTDDLIREMEKHSTTSLRGFFHQWLNRPEVLQIQGKWRYDSQKAQVEITLAQRQSGNFLFDVPVEMELIDSNGNRRLLKGQLKERQLVLQFPCDRKPVTILPDPHTVLLAKFELSGD